MSQTPTPIAINLKKQSRMLRIEFDNEQVFEFSFEFLRVHSPSAEVRGHGNGDAVLQTGKQDVLITDVEPVGHYAVKLRFDDGHDSGLYSWEHFYDLGQNQKSYWQDYLEKLEQAGASRS